MTDFRGLRALVTGGASGIGLATARLLAERGAAVAVLDLAPDGLRPAAAGLHGRRNRRRVGTRRRRRGRRRARRPRHPGQQRRHRRGRHRRGQRRRRVAQRARRQRPRHRADHPGRAAAPARLVGTPRSSTPAPSRPPPVCRSGRCTPPARARCSRSPWPWPPTTSARASGSTASTPVRSTPPGSAGCSTPPPTRPPNAPRWPPASRPAAWSTAEEVAGAIAYLASPLSGATTGTALAVDGGMQGLRPRPARG